MKTNNHILGLARAALISMTLLSACALDAQSIDRAVPKDNIAIENDVNAFNTQQAKVHEFRKKYKEDARAGHEETAAIDKKELQTALAELKKMRSNLISDAREISRNNRQAIRNTKKAVRLDQGDLKRSHKELREAEKRGDEAVIRDKKASVHSWQHILAVDKARLVLEQDKLAFDRAFLKAEVKRLQGGGQGTYLVSQ